MEFGKVSPQELEKTDFTLPPDHPNNVGILTGAKPNNPKVYVGCAKWGRKDWVGKIYPKGTKDADFLQVYGTQFNSIELNSTFYQTPTPTQVEKWYTVTPKGFLFLPKFPDVITHLQRLKNTGPALDNFLTSMSGLKEKLGPIFLMPHPQMGPKTFETIEAFIRDMPKDVDLFLELRHPDWYLPENANHIFGLMEATKTGAIITDSSGRRDCVHMRLTTPSAFIRFVGNSLHPTDYTRIDAWVERIKQWLNEGLQNLYFFMHQHEELYSPELCKYLIEKLNAECGLSLQVPRFVTGGKLL